MAKIKFIGQFLAKWMKDFKVPKGYILFRYDHIYRQSLGTVLKKLDDHQNNKLQKLIDSGKDFEEKDFIRDLDIELEFYYSKRTIDQNALMWALYQVEANEMNGGMKGHKDQMVTANELYENDLQEYCELDTLTTKRKNLASYMENYRVISIRHKDNVYPVETAPQFKAFNAITIDADEKITIKYIFSTSLFNTLQMAQWVEMIFNRMAYNGVAVTNPGDIENYWHKWRNMLNDEKIVLHDNVMTQKEYKDFNPICEACGAVITEGKGELHHIKAVGMGSDRTDEPYRNYSSNWLHLCIHCHREIFHQKGVNEFLKLFRHLTYKVKTALNRDYEEIEYYPEIQKIESVVNKIDKVKELSREQQHEEIIKKYKRGELTQDEACIQLENLDYDPKEINPEWIGLY